MAEKRNDSDTLSANREITLTRIIDAPRELVFKAWTNPEMMSKWWGPKSFTAPTIKMDLRVGGKYLFCMRSPEGKDYWTTGVYKEINPPERLVCTDNFADENGNIVPASAYGFDGEWPELSIITVTFENLDDNKTKMTLRHEGLPTGEHGEMAKAGWTTTLEKLEEILAELKK